MSDMEQIKQLGDQLAKGLHALNETKEQMKKDTDALLDSKLDKIAKDIAATAEKQQNEIQALKARVERVGPGDEDEAKPEEAKGVKAAFAQFLRKGDRGLAPEQVKLLATYSNPDGGYMVPVENAGLIQGRIFQTSPIRQIANVITTSNKSVEMTLDDQEAQVRWAGEAPSSQSETNTPQVGRIEITARKMEAYPSISQEMLSDAAFAVDSWLTNMLGRDFGRAENTTFVTGAGVDRPRGFTSYANWSSAGVYTRDAVEQIANGSTSAVTENGLLDLMGALKAEYHTRATFVMSQATLANIMKVAGSTTFRFLNLQPTTGATGPNYSGAFLLDKPVLLASDMPAIASNALSVAFGDFSVGYTIVDRVGIAIQPDPFTLPGRVRYYATKRVGGAVTNFDAIKLLRMSNS